MAINKYVDNVIELIRDIEKTQKCKLEKAAELFFETVKKNQIIHVFGTGHSHMIATEMFVKAGSLANINAMLESTIITNSGARKVSMIEKLQGLAEIIWNQYEIDKNDIMIIISNSGRNSVPIEMAIKAKAEGLKLIVITSLNHSQNCESRHKSGKKLYEFGDIVIDNRVPAGDCLMDFNGIKSGSGSTIAGSLIVNSILVETLEKLIEANMELPIFGSQNVDGFNNEDLYNKYQDRIKHM
ncbi:MAG: SIS domain-containing protein [Bacillota bacterium]|nr:SIS domain-containing protein [Bacillota bacterium]